MTPRAKVLVKITMTFSTKKLIIRQCLRLDHLNLNRMLVLTSRWPNGKGQVKVISSTKQAYNSAMLGLGRLNVVGMFLLTRK